jgi:hypothetical protein
MSCFMLGDHIAIETRRDYGRERGTGKPWLVEIQGLSGMVVLKPGEDNQPVGTKVTIKFRQHIPAFDLLKTLKQCALAAEYPIMAKRTVLGRTADLSIPPGVKSPPTFLEGLGLKQLVRYERDLGAMDGSGLYQGRLTKSFLSDENGRLVLSK